MIRPAPRLFQPQRALLLVMTLNALVMMLGVLLATQSSEAATMRDLRVPLAPDAPARSTTGDRWLVLLHADGEATVAGRVVPANEVDLAVMQEAQARPEARVRIEAEGGVVFARIRGVLEACARGGLPDVDVAIQSGSAP